MRISSKQELYNKLKGMKITLTKHSGSLKEGKAVDGLSSQNTLTEGSAREGNSESHQTTPGDEGNRSHDDNSNISSMFSKEEDHGPTAERSR